MTTKKFRPGTRADITIRGVAILEQYPSGSVAILADAHDGGPATWAMPPQAEVIVVTPDFQHNTLWGDATGHLWLAQLDPEQEELEGEADEDAMLLVSSLGRCTKAEAMELYGPFSPVAWKVS